MPPSAAQPLHLTDVVLALRVRAGTIATPPSVVTLDALRAAVAGVIVARDDMVDAADGTASDIRVPRTASAAVTLRAILDAGGAQATALVWFGDRWGERMISASTADRTRTRLTEDTRAAVLLAIVVELCATMGNPSDAVDAVVCAAPVTEAVKQVRDERIVRGIDRSGLFVPHPPMLIRGAPAFGVLRSRLEIGIAPVAGVCAGDLTVALVPVDPVVSVVGVADG